MLKREFDLDTFLHDDPGQNSGIYALWLRVFTLSVFELLNRRYSTDPAESFLFDPGNVFFDLVADKLGYESESLRKRIREAQRRSGLRQ